MSEEQESESSGSGGDKERRGIQSIEVGGQLLMALSRHGRPMPLRELAKAANMPPGKAHPYLVSYSKLGMVTQEASSGYYWLGPTAIQLGLVSLRMLNPVREATPFADELARQTGHSVALAVWSNHGPTIVYLFDAIYPLHTNIRTGTVMSLAGTATGRLFAAYLPTRLIEESMIEDNRRLGPDIASPADPQTLQKMVEEVRNHGVSRSVNNPTPGVCSFSAPVFDYSGNIVLAITLMGRSTSFNHNWDSPQATAVKAAANEVSKRLGNQSSKNQ